MASPSRACVGLFVGVVAFAACSMHEDTPSDAGISPASKPSPRVATTTLEDARALVDALRARPALSALLSPHVTVVSQSDGFAHVAPATALAVSTLAPLNATGPLRLTPPRGSDAAIELSSEGAASSAGRAVESADGTAIVYAEAWPSTDVVIAPQGDGAEELRVLRDARAPTTFRWTMHLGPGLTEARVTTLSVGDRTESSIDVLDATGFAHVHCAPIVAIDANGLRRALSVRLEGKGRTRTLVASLEAEGLAYPIAIDPLWSAAPIHPGGPKANIGALLPDGRAMVMGGYSPYTKIYDPKTNTWADAGDVPFTWKGSAAGTGLTGGDVIAVSGTASDTARFVASTGKWKLLAGKTVTPCNSCLVAPLLDGRALKINGSGSGVDCEVYDDTTDTWHTVAPMLTTRTAIRSTTLLAGVGKGKVFVLDTGLGQTPQIYTPAAGVGAGSWKYGAIGVDRQVGASPVALADGRVLVMSTIQGGSTPPKTGEVYDPASDTWTLTGLTFPRANAGVVLLPSGRVLVAGGEESSGAIAAEAFLFDPTTLRLDFIDALPAAQSQQVMIAFPDGKAISVGGIERFGTASVLTQVYTPIANGGSCVFPAYAVACSSGFCVDSVCCEKASCTHGTCNGARPGVCTKDQGEKCTTADDCTSKSCVDGYCCDKACGGQCEACDLPGDEGTCGPVSGAPHGKRTACDSGGGDLCKARECNGAKDPSSCVGFKANGTVVCKTPSCAGSDFVPQSTCSGDGTCVAPTKSSCGRYACDPGTNACRTSCATSSDCASGFSCVSGRCTEAAHCSADLQSSLSTDGTSINCAPFVCGGDGNCLKTCATSADCTAGFACDTSVGVPTCKLAAGDTGGDGGGCGVSATTGASDGSVSLLLAMLGIAELARRRRARLG